MGGGKGGVCVGGGKGGVCGGGGEGGICVEGGEEGVCGDEEVCVCVGGGRPKVWKEVRYGDEWDKSLHCKHIMYMYTDSCIFFSSRWLSYGKVAIPKHVHVYKWITYTCHNAHRVHMCTGLCSTRRHPNITYPITISDTGDNCLQYTCLAALLCMLPPTLPDRLETL